MSDSKYELHAEVTLPCPRSQQCRRPSTLGKVRRPAGGGSGRMRTPSYPDRWRKTFRRWVRETSLRQSVRLSLNASPHCYHYGTPVTTGTHLPPLGTSWHIGERNDGYF